MGYYNYGASLDSSKIPVVEYEKAAKDWAEGSKNLEELLFYCLTNNIITQGCCTGNKEFQTWAYLQLELSEKNLKPIMKIANRFYDLEGVNMIFTSCPGISTKFSIHVPKKNGEEVFGETLKELSNGKDMSMDELKPGLKNIIDVTLNNKTPKTLLEVQYFIKNNKKNFFIATDNPNYSESYYDNKDMVAWTDGGSAIQGNYDKIMPIIDGILKKEPIEYSNYLEKIKRVGKTI